ncbi:MAG: hypothetical protein LRZ85_02010 [Alphaproteobacteria bacterium]|nr:hypothetical protein [Alphaproteobacteria bacterium]MCD8525736.1 hypothetical protein [Alphaproteobacteria bacterium]MCD8571000.1 hypothetical protein [Alphaproteobacteria bacterium]
MKQSAGPVASLMIAANVLAGAVSPASAAEKPKSQPTDLAEMVLKSKTGKMQSRTSATLAKEVDTALSWACSGSKRNGWVVNSLTLGAFNAAGKIKWGYSGLAQDYLFGADFNDPFVKRTMPYTHGILSKVQGNIQAALAAHPDISSSLEKQIGVIAGKVKAGKKGNVADLLKVVDLACANQPVIKKLVDDSAKGINFERIANEVKAARASVPGMNFDEGP